MDTDARLRGSVPFHRLPRALQDRALKLAGLRSLARGETLYEQGASDDAVHYLVSGRVELLWHGKLTRTVSASNQAATRPLDPPGPKRYTVRVIEDATFAVLPRAALERLVHEAEANAERAELEVSDIATERSSDWMIRLLQSDLFSSLPATVIQKIFARMEAVPCQAEDVVVRQGERGTDYYVIESGYCEVSRALPGGRGQIHLAELGPGATFGEEALISGKPRNASVTMLSDGMLMRLGGEDFAALILAHVLHPVDMDTACDRVAQGGAWLDVRYPEAHAEYAPPASENIPLNMLRLQSGRLSRERRYVVCADDVEQATIAAFLLAERGFTVEYLDTTLAELGRSHPDQIVSPGPGATAPAGVVSFPGAEPPAGPQADAPMEPSEQSGPLDNTITRIAALYTHQEAQESMNDVTPVEKYADTATGQELAGIIDELAEEHATLAGDASNAPAASKPPGTRGAWPVDAQEILNDGIAAVMREMEGRLREAVVGAVAARESALEADYRDKLERMRALTRREIEQKEASLARAYEARYHEKEQVLRAYYKKLIALANRISRQKAQLQEAKKQFESKLGSANRLYREVEEMRELLKDQIVYLDREAIQEIPGLQISL